LLALELQIKKGGSLGSKFLTRLDSSIHTFFFENVSSRIKHSINLDTVLIYLHLKNVMLRAATSLKQHTMYSLSHVKKVNTNTQVQQLAFFTNHSSKICIFVDFVSTGDSSIISFGRRSSPSFGTAHPGNRDQPRNQDLEHSWCLASF